MTAKIIALANQKGGVGKTTTTNSLGVGLAKAGKKVLLVDLDPQGNLTQGLGFPDTDKIEITMYELLESIILRKELPDSSRYILNSEGVDFISANIQLSSIDTLLINAINRENKLKQFLNLFKDDYDYILIDCQPSLGMLPINAFVAADSIIIPVQAHYYSAKGLELLLNLILMVKKELNPNLCIDGILMTMCDLRTNFAKGITAIVQKTYGEYIRVYQTQIPVSIRATEATSEGESIYSFEPTNNVAIAYTDFVKEVLKFDKEKCGSRPCKTQVV